jgi:hypothetical protein
VSRVVDWKGVREPWRSEFRHVRYGSELGRMSERDLLYDARTFLDDMAAAELARREALER